MKKSPQRHWRDVPKDELDAEFSRRSNPLAIDKKKANEAKVSRIRARRQRAMKKKLA